VVCVPDHASSRRVFLTGATGFIGRRLGTALAAGGGEVAALVLPGELALLPASIRAYPGDVTDGERLAHILNEVKPEVIYHLAAVGITNPGLPMREAAQVNVYGTLNLLEAVRPLACLQRMVLVGTSYAYGARCSDDGLDPFNTYSASKVAAWAFARAAYNAWHLPMVWVRPFQVYGPGQHCRALVPAAIRAALRDDVFRMTGGDQQRDFIYIEDVIEGLLIVGRTDGLEGRTLDLGTGVLRRVRDVVAQIWSLTGSRGEMEVGALPYRPGEVPAIPADVSRTRRLTGWEARVALEQGLTMTIDALHEAGGALEENYG
jgi:nucleoside-diphosphate-sugar epimerase